MKKFYTRLMVALVATVLAIPAKAAVDGVASLFGTYRFTANVEYLDASYKDQLSGDCEVKIIKDATGIFACEIDGLFGIEDSYQLVSKMGEMEDGKQALKIVNPNGGNFDAWGSFAGWMTDIEGNNPFGTSNYGPLYYVLNEDGSVITLPDFSFITITDFSAEKGTIVAKFTNAKLTLVAKEEIAVADISGDYHFTPSQEYDYGVEPNFPKEFDMSLTNKGDNKAYDVTMSWASIGDLKLEGKFDGNTLSLPYENAKVGEYSILDTYQNTKGNITFNLVGDNLSLTSGILFAKNDSVMVYWAGGGLAKKAGVEPATPAYVGTYKAKATVAYKPEGTPDTPTEGDIVIEFDEMYNMYFVTTFLGYDTYTMNQGGIEFRPDAEDPSKGVIVTEAMYQYLDISYMSDDFKQMQYLVLRDVNGALGEIPVTFDADGTMTIKDCSIFTTWTGKDEPDAFVTYYSPIVATVDAPQPADWTGEHALTSVTYAYTADGTTAPTTGSIKVTYYEKTNEYLVEELLGYDLYSMNYGGLLLTIDPTDDHKATMECGTADFDPETMQETVIMDANGQVNKATISLTMNEDGTVSVGDFQIGVGPYFGPYTAVASTVTVDAIKGIESEQDGAELYTISGVKTTANQKGIVLMKKGGKVVKVLK